MWPLTSFKWQPANHRVLKVLSIDIRIFTLNYDILLNTETTTVPNNQLFHYQHV